MLNNINPKTSSTTVEYPLADILRYTYEGVETGIELLPNEQSVSFNKSDNAVLFKNLPVGTPLYIYSSNGTLLEKRIVQDSQPVTLSVASRPSGVYIFKAGSQTIKLMKR